jgi:hypothetical protein
LNWIKNACTSDAGGKIGTVYGVYDETAGLERLRDLRMRTTLFPPGLGFAAPFLPLGGFIDAGVFLDEPDISLPAVT